MVRAGTLPVVLVAPHAGRRDPVRRPWGSGPLRMNDLHTASLGEELAAATGAALLTDPDVDRNDVDLNRLSAAHDRRPDFLEALARLVADAQARHGGCTVVTVHGWNVVQPAVDVGLGCTPGLDAFAVDASAAVSPAFAASAVRTLVDACGARGIAATVGARYPARAAENLIQLFAPRHRDDGRALVRRLAALGPRTNALQLELGVPLRWPGAWRARLTAALHEAMPALATPEPAPCEAAAPGRPARGSPAGVRPRSMPAGRRRVALETAGGTMAALAAIDPGGGRLLLFPPDGGLLLFTGEHAGGAPLGRVGGMSLTGRPADGLHLRFAGPVARFPDTTPFLDLEQGLARAHVLDEAHVAIDFHPDHAGGDGAGEFGRVRGEVRMGGRAWEVDAGAWASDAGLPGAGGPRLRAALRLAGGEAVSLVVALPHGEAGGFLCDGRSHVPVEAARVALGSAGAPLDAFALEIRLADGRDLRVRAAAVHRLPVVRGGSVPPVRLLYAACTADGTGAATGWCELVGA